MPRERHQVDTRARGDIAQMGRGATAYPPAPRTIPRILGSHTPGALGGVIRTTGPTWEDRRSAAQSAGYTSTPPRMGRRKVRDNG